MPEPDANGVVNSGDLRTICGDDYPQLLSIAFPGGDDGSGYVLIDCKQAELGTLSISQLEDGSMFAVIGLALDHNRALYVPYTAEMCREGAKALNEMAERLESGVPLGPKGDVN